LRFYGYPKVLWPYLRSTNLMERFIREIRRGTKVRGQAEGLSCPQVSQRGGRLQASLPGVGEARREVGGAKAQRVLGGEGGLGEDASGAVRPPYTYILTRPPQGSHTPILSLSRFLPPLSWSSKMEPSSNPPAEKAPGGKALEEAQAFLQKLRSRRDKEESAKPILEVQQGGSLSGVLLAGEVALLYGEAKVGKSRAAVALLGWPKGGKAEEKEGGERSAASSREDVARSGSWRVWAPRELRFYLYHATETRYAHLKKYAKALGAEDITENILPFNDVEELERALQAIHTLAERRGRPALVVVDSLIKLVPPQQSENEAKVMDAVMARLKRAISPPEREPLVGLLVIHHAAKGNGGPRGSGAIAANADHILRLEPRRDGEEDWGLLLYERGRGDV
jgi:hypothetical protein